MKKYLITILVLVAALVSHANNILTERFEYANVDGAPPVGWTCNDASWLCGFQEKDHNRKPFSGYWYAYTNGDESWMFMPIYMSPSARYRFSYWAISDGSYTVEFWAGTQADAGTMIQLLFSETVNIDEYDKFEAYIESISGNYDYLGIRAIASEGAYFCTIDDIIVDQVDQYSFRSSPVEIDTVLQPGAHFHYYNKIINEGFESLTIYMTPHTEFFEDIHFYVDGQMVTQFHIDSDETVLIRGEATLRSDIEPGSTCWFDVMYTIDCGCATAMFTYMVNVISDGVDENLSTIALYPNPSTGKVAIEGNGLMTITNTLGQEVLRKEIIDKEIFTLENGIYIVKINGIRRKVIIQ